MVIRSLLKELLPVYFNKVVCFSDQTRRLDLIDFPNLIRLASQPSSICFKVLL